MSMPNISIIMPLYNAEKYIVQSLTSILNQIDTSAEVVVVNDGSTDNSLVLINQYFKSFIESNQLRLITQENHGVSTARNIGITNANGQYIGFMDADDLALDGYFNVLLKTISTSPDIVEFGYKNFDSSIKDTYKNRISYSNSNFGSHKTIEILNEVYSKAKWYPWTRIFKRDLFSNIKFPEGVKFCEDLMTIPQIYEKSNSIIVLSEALYGYRNNINSATFKIQPDYVNNLINFYNTIPKSNEIRYQYLRLSVAFAITSCQSKYSDTWMLPKHIKDDLNKLRWKLPIYVNFDLRKLGVVLYPNIYATLMKIYRAIKMRVLDI